jgi:hypothetical protein
MLTTLRDAIERVIVVAGASRHTIEDPEVGFPRDRLHAPIAHCKQDYPRMISAKAGVAAIGFI